MRGVVAVAIAASVIAHGARVPAAPVQLGWVRGDGAETCIDGGTIVREVVRRLGRDPFGESPVQRIEVLVSHAGAHDHAPWVARIFVRDASGALTGTREIASDAPTCDPLGTAAASAIALLVDPDAPVVELPPPPPPAPPPLSIAPRPNAPHGLIRPRGTEVTARAIVLGNALPVVSFGGAVAIDAAVWGPLRVSAGLFAPLDVHLATPDDDVAFGLVAGWLQLCGEIWPHDRVGLSLCLGVALGSQRGYGRDAHIDMLTLPRVTPVAPLWFGPMAEGRIVVPVVGPLEMVASVAGVVAVDEPVFAVHTYRRDMPRDPVIRDEHFAVQGGAVAVLGSLGAGVRF